MGQNSLGKFFSKRIGSILAGWLSAETNDTVASAHGIAEPLVLSVLDSFLAARLSGSIWPATMVLGAAVVGHILSLFLSAEAGRILIGLIVDSAIVWGLLGVCRGIKVALPHIKFWIVTLNPPRRHVRLLMFQIIRFHYKSFLESKKKPTMWSSAFQTALKEFQTSSDLEPDELAFRFSDRLADTAMRHLIKRFSLLIAPFFGAFLYYRMIIYPQVIHKYASIGSFPITLYPFAALCDEVFGTHFRHFLMTF